MHIAKKGLRILGIAESFAGRDMSTIAGVVMRKDLVIDGAAFTRVTVGGMDATEKIIDLFLSLERRDINCLMLSGCVISWFNVIDPEYISDETGIPVIGVTYEDSEGLLDDIRHHFPGDEKRADAYLKLGTRTAFDLATGHRIYLRSWGIMEPDAAGLCSDLTLNGKVPEPLRVARIMARGVMQLTGC